MLSVRGRTCRQTDTEEKDRLQSGARLARKTANKRTLGLWVGEVEGGGGVVQQSHGQQWVGGAGANHSLEERVARAALGTRRSGSCDY